ncbi:hypothetical protein GR328_11875 [Microvirga makkahensis]|uniref:Uncharacterized protein n=1 Tax=Microvirga makkahensis TaxID=1128670 RepID=A0A7X3SPE9_9HYPH|nr:hypothetical protein [Microvirga makkahensis]
MMNLSGPLTVRVTVRTEKASRAEMVRPMGAAKGGRARYRRLADRAAALYSPIVHTAAPLTFLGRLTATGDWRRCVTIAIAVLIVTCAYALGPAAPIVDGRCRAPAVRKQNHGQGRLPPGTSGRDRRRGLRQDLHPGAGRAHPGQCGRGDSGGDAGRHGMTMGSRHPAARATAEATARRVSQAPAFDRLEEVPALGLEARLGGHMHRLGRPGRATGQRASDDAPHPPRSRSWRELANCLRPSCWRTASAAMHGRQRAV